MIEELDITNISKLLSSRDVYDSKIMVQCATLHPDDSTAPELIFWLSVDQNKDLELMNS
jgi:hypothetical protein